MPVDALTVLKLFRGAAKAGKWIDKSPIEATLEAAGAKVGREMGQVCYAVVRALIAVQLGADPNDEDVHAYMLDAIDDPSFPSRAYRLFGEGKKSPSKRRRHFLAAILFGLPFTTMSSDDRDRVDMLAERLVPEDIKLLDQVAKISRAGGRTLYVEDPSTRAVRIAGVKLGHSEAFIAFTPPGPAFKALEAQGCLYRSTGLREDIAIDGVHETGIFLEVTALGQLLLKALEDVRAGLDDESSTDTPASTAEAPAL